MKKKPVPATLETVLKLLSKRLEDFSGESHRSYQKAYSSFQIYLISHYDMSEILTKNVVINWIIDIVSRGLTPKTVTFYIEKIASLYGAVAHKFEGGRLPIFKEIKKSLKEYDPNVNYSAMLNQRVNQLDKSQKISLLKFYKSEDLPSLLKTDDHVRTLWAMIALKSSVKADVIKACLGEVPSNLKYLNLCPDRDISDREKMEACKGVEEFLGGEPIRWFAMRLRPRVKFEQILSRFSAINDIIKMPELFYPCDEIAKKVGRKVVWKGKPLIHDIVFFRNRKSEIYRMFTHLYDLAWCYRLPGGGAGQYATIPDQAMEEFKKSIGFLTPDYEILPAGEMELNPGDEVIIVNGKTTEERGRILKKPSFDADGNKIYRVSLLNGHSHWDIGIDARLLKKATS